MESEGKVSQETSKKDDCQEQKTDNELTSDRESSVESFHTNKSELSTAAESELIDVDDIELSDEESWLYKSPKRVPSKDRALNTRKWVQNDPEKMDDNTMLTMTKNALVSKLSQLQMLKADTERKTAKDSFQVKKDMPAKATRSDNDKPLSTTECESSAASSIQETAEVSNELLDVNSVKGKENEVLDVVDVHKIAQLQEESLRQSTGRFLTLGRGEKKGYDKNNFLMLNSKLSKPASFEALNLCNGKLEDDYMHKIKRINGYGSSSSLHTTTDSHRGSLPNINPGYYSLRSKKSKRQNDRQPFPLPICPSRLPLNGADTYAPSPQSPHTPSPLSDHQSRTLPSSHRASPSPRRESASFLPRRDSAPNFTRRESASNVSPLASPTLYQRSRGILPSPTKALRREVAMSPTEFGSRSGSRRLPLTTMHNRSGGGSPRSPRKEDLRIKGRMPSPGPVSRSGIPVPSTYMARVNSDEESWSNDCY